MGIKLLLSFLLFIFIIGVFSAGTGDVFADLNLTPSAAHKMTPLFVN